MDLAYMAALPQEEFTERRQKVFAQMQPNSALLLFSEIEKRRNNDCDFPFRQDSYFWYLTGFNEPNAALLLIKTEDAEKATEGEFSEKWKVDHQLVCAGHNFMDVMNLEANKGNGLAKIQEYLNITKEETMAFGDNINDLEMLGNAAYSYAVGDAREEVRQAARFTAPPMTQDGVLQILKTLL